jgi:hypothetical protein
MKKLILLAALTASSAQAKDADWFRLCATVATTSAGIMEARQVGVEMQDLIAAVSEVDKGKEQSDMTKDMIKVVIAAYEQPRYESPEAQRMMVTDFKNEWFLKCTKQINRESKK